MHRLPYTKLVPTLVALAYSLPLIAEEGAANNASREINALGDVALVSEERLVEAVSRRRQRIETAPQPVVVLTADDLFNLPAVTLPDRLRYEAGIDVYQSRHGQYDIGIHGYNGMNNTRLLAVYDGRQFTLDEFGSTMWLGVLPLSDMVGIEIVKGPSSVTYGANAFGGVVAIQGREPSDHHQLIGLSDLGTFGQMTADATALGPAFGKGYYKFSAGGTTLDDWTGTTGYADYTPSSRTKNTEDVDLLAYRSRGVFGWHLAGGSRIEADYRGFNQREWDFVNDLNNGSGRVETHQQDLGGRLTGPWGEIRYNHVWSTKDYSNQKSQYVPTVPAYGDFHYVQAGFKDQSDTVRAQGNHAFGNHFVGAGCEFLRSSSFSNLWSNQGNYQNEGSWERVFTYNRAVFAEDQWSLFRAWTITAGLRIDDHSQAGTNASPRVALNWAQSSDQFWRLSWSSGYRLPTDIETHLRQFYFRSDEDLRAEKIQEVNLGWNRRLDRNVNFSADAFYSHSKDLIWLMPLPEAEMAQSWLNWLLTGPDATKQPGPFFSYANRDMSTDVWGATLSGDWRLDGMPVTIFSNGTWQRLRHRDNIIYDSDGFLNPATGYTTTIFRFHQDLGRSIDAPPEWKANLGVRYEGSNFFASTVGRYVDSRHVMSFAYSDFLVGTVYEQEIPAYTALDCSCGWNFGTAGKYERFVRLSVLDIFDTAHYEAYQANQSQLRLDYNRQYTSEVGRSIVLQGGWTF